MITPTHLFFAFRFVLTAAHCVFNRKWQNMKVVLGDHDTTMTDIGEVSIQICGVQVHPYYSSTSMTEDIALIELCETPKFSPTIQPIGLAPAKVSMPEGSKVVVAGWGTLQEGGRVANMLRAVEVKTVSLRKCLLGYSWVKEGQICAGIYDEGRKDSCQGDSGGALWWNNTYSKVIYQVGIVSSGKGCARKHYPGIYTSIPYYFDWILNTMSKFASAFNKNLTIGHNMELFGYDALLEI